MNLVLRYKYFIKMNSIGATGPIGDCLPRTISAIESAIIAGNINKVGELIDHVNDLMDSADVNLPIHVASKHNNIDIIKLLLDHGADINATNYWKTTPLMYACVYGNLAVIKFLLEHGADMSMRNYWGKTAKDRAVEYNRVDCVQLLVKFSCQ